MPTIAVSDLAKHCTTEDLWIAINGEVYDFTKFAPEHPGRPEVIYRYAGADASEAYNEAHGPSLVKGALDAKCHIGSLDVQAVPEVPAMTVDAQGSEEDRLEGKPALEAIINLDDFQKAACKALSAKAMAFITSGSNDNMTSDANHSILNRIWLRPRIMRDVSNINTSTIIFGCKLDLPIYIAPTGGAQIGGADGELTLARGAAAGGIIHCFATPSSYPYDEILENTPKHSFFQLYVNKDRHKSEAAIKQVAASGKVKAIFVTVDVPVVPKRESDERIRSKSKIVIRGVNVSIGGADAKGGGLARQASSFIDPTVDWSILKWLRGLTNLPILVKGIQTSHDARIAHSMGCDGIILSNHGGRAADHAPPAIMILLELQKNCPEVLESMEVLVDGGFRRGGDVVKAICLGASAVGIGRSFLYSLSYGQEGVEHAICILRDEVETAMRLCGMTDLMRDAHPGYVNTNDVDHLIPQDQHPYAKKIMRHKGRL